MKITKKLTPTTVEEYKKQGLVFKTVTDEMLYEVALNNKEVERATNSFGKSQSQYMRNLMTFDSHTPLRNLRQILAEINKKQDALDEAQYRHNKRLLKLEELKDKTSKKAKLKLSNTVHQVKKSALHIEGAIKELYAMQMSYNDIMKTHNISDIWDEEAFEQEEEEYHIKKAFTQGIADLQQGALSSGNNIYFRQIGINPVVASSLISSYIQQVKAALARGEDVSIDSQYDFIDAVYDKFKGSSKKALERSGIATSYNDKALYKELDNKEK